MTETEVTDTKRAVDIALLQCFDATVFAGSVTVTEEQERRLRALLASLEAFGIIIQPRADQRQCDFDAFLDYLRESVGATLVDAALASGDEVRPSVEPPPVAMMPVWAFEPEGDDPDDQDVLLSSGRLWGTDTLIEALRVESEEQPEPVPAVRSRFDRWVKADGGGRDRAVMRLPGLSGCYVLFAAAAN